MSTVRPPTAAAMKRLTPPPNCSAATRHLCKQISKALLGRSTEGGPYHDVIPRGARASDRVAVAIPAFPQRRRSLLNHPPEAWVGSLRQHVDRSAVRAVLVQDLEYEGGPEDTAVHVRAGAERRRGGAALHPVRREQRVRLNGCCRSGGQRRVVVVVRLRVGVSRVPVPDARDEHGHGIVDQLLRHGADVQREDVVGLGAGVVAAALAARLRRAAGRVGSAETVVEHLVVGFAVRLEARRVAARVRRAPCATTSNKRRTVIQTDQPSSGL